MHEQYAQVPNADGTSTAKAGRIKWLELGARWVRDLLEVFESPLEIAANGGVG